MKINFLTVITAISLASGVISQPVFAAGTFGEDVDFLKAHTDVVILGDASGHTKVAVVPAWQGRVMTSTAGGDGGLSFGWMNRELIASHKFQEHINAFGGEDRFWMGPEGGQFSVFFVKGAKFELANWQTPKPFDTIPWKIINKSSDKVLFSTEFSLTNFSGTRFDLKVRRQIQLLNRNEAWGDLIERQVAPENMAANLKAIQDGKGVPANPPSDLEIVSYKSENEIANTGKAAWKKETGLLSIWILGMYNPSPKTTIVVPIVPGPESELGSKVTSDYFGPVPPDRIKLTDNAIYFSGDGKFRSKIGVNPRRSKAVLGSYDAENKVLTIIQFTQTSGVVDYVNSLWKIQDNPYGGDAANSYNDGPPEPGAKPMGPFYEMESSSSAFALNPEEKAHHVHRTTHLRGSEASLDMVARYTLGVSLSDIQNGLKSP